MRILAASVPTDDRSQTVVAKRMVAGMGQPRSLLDRSAIGPPVGMIRKSLPFLCAAVLVAGCAAPAAEQSQTPSSTSPAAGSASPTPATASPTPSPTSEPTAAPTPSLAFGAPEGFLPPNSIVEVVVDQLLLRDEPGLGAPVEGTALKGERFSAAGWFGPVRRDGLDWYRLGPATVGDLDAWAAAGSGADRYLELAPSDCPTAEPDLATVISMANDWDRLACFADRSLTLEGTYGCGGCGGTTVGDFEPRWLAFPMNFNLLWSDFEARSGYLELRVAPDSGLELPANGSIVRVTGHFNDPASTTCSMSTFDGEQAMLVDSRTAELFCRERFVLDAFEVIGTDPNFP